MEDQDGQGARPTGFVTTVVVLLAIGFAALFIPSTHTIQVIGFAIITLVVIGSTTAMYCFGTRALRVSAANAAHRKLVLDLAQFLSTLKDAETGHRGFIITGDERYLKPYYAALARFPSGVCMG